MPVDSTTRIGTAKLMECLLCQSKHSEKDVLRGLYFIQTFICFDCYTRMKKLPYNQSCFGKPTVDGYLGYDPSAEECSLYCPDRFVCPLFLNE